MTVQLLEVRALYIHKLLPRNMKMAILSHRRRKLNNLASHCITGKEVSTSFARFWWHKLIQLIFGMTSQEQLLVRHFFDQLATSLLELHHFLSLQPGYLLRSC